MARPPNILWVVTTQWRAQALGCAGDSNARTPALDRFAAGGTEFIRAFTPHPFGPFARAAMLTGRHSPENGVRDYYDPLPEGTRTIAHDLAERGYATAFFGKWHLSARDPAAPLVGQAHARAVVAPGARGGFSLWEGFESGFQLNDPWLHGSRIPAPERFAGYQPDVLSERAVRWISRDAGNPWFCVVSFETPHPPYDAPAAGCAGPDPAALVLRANVPRGGGIEARARRELSGYYTHIEATDRAVGRLIGGVPANATLVVFTSVHGDMHGSHGVFRKGWPYEESIAIPLIVGMPAGRGNGRKGANGSVFSLVDLPRFTLAAAEGRAWVPPGDSAAISMPSVVGLPLQCDRTWSGIRTRGRKLVLNADGSPWLYFDMEKDPLEMLNLAADPARSAEIRDLAQRC